MSRKPKMIQPINGSFSEILSAIAMGGGVKKPKPKPKKKK
jgi:hypothetical protein